MGRTVGRLVGARQDSCADFYPLKCPSRCPDLDAELSRLRGYAVLAVRRAVSAARHAVATVRIYAWPNKSLA